MLDLAVRDLVEQVRWIDQAITSLDPAGHLAYRGWDVTQAATSARYEEVAAWLWGSTIGPNEHWSSDRAGARDRAGRCRRRCPPTTPLPDRLRVTVAALRSGRSAPQRPSAGIGGGACRAPSSPRWSRRCPPVDARDEPTADRLDRAAAVDRVSHRSSRRRARVRALDRALSLLADHELATSTFGVRIAASTWADPYLLLLTGLAIVGGPLHGGASEFVRTLLRDAVATTPEARDRTGVARRRARARLRALGLHGSRPASPGAARRDRTLQAAARAVARRAGRARA